MNVELFMWGEEEQERESEINTKKLYELMKDIWKTIMNVSMKCVQQLMQKMKHLITRYKKSTNYVNKW